MSIPRKLFGYGAAAALVPYLLIKVSWVLLSGEAVALNLVTIVMALAGIMLGLALVRPWGARIPAWPLLACAWVGCGFLIPMVPYLVITAMLDPPEQPDPATPPADPVMPDWEGWLIQASFLVMAVCLAVAVPLYVRDRWPAPFRGRLGDARPTRVGPLRAAVLLGAAAVGVLTLYWAAGGTAGLAHPSAADAKWRLLMGTTAFWALAGAAALWSLTTARPAALPRWLPVVVAWVASGFLVAWSAWKLPFVAYLASTSSPEMVWPENLAVATVQYLTGVTAGAAMLVLLVRRPRHQVAAAGNSPVVT